MLRVVCTAAAVVGFVGLAAAPASAAAAGPLPVEVKTWEDGASVGSRIGGQPLFGASADVSEGEACVGFSYQVPQCVEVGPIEVSTG